VTVGSALVALGILIAGCAAESSGDSTTPRVVSTSTSPAARTTIIGTSTRFSTVYLTTGTLTAPGDTPSSAGATSKSSGTSRPTSTGPAAIAAECPYIAADDVTLINGQHHGPTSIIPVKPYPVCIFTRADGGYMATTRIVVAATPAKAVAVVDEFAPIDQSFPVNDPAGWSGGAMSLPLGNADNPLNRSVYAVSKDKIAIIAESDQGQSIKGRQMVEQIVQNMGW
jgi:hypothetical protein